MGEGDEVSGKEENGVEDEGERKKAVVVYTGIEREETEMLEIEPLASVGEQEKNSPVPTKWVIERVKGLCCELGLSFDGHEEEMMALFFDTETKRVGRRAEPVIDVSEKSGIRGNRELK